MLGCNSEKACVMKMLLEFQGPLTASDDEVPLTYYAVTVALLLEAL